MHTSRLCAVPWLRPVLEPTPLPIVCRPLLSEQQMEQYNRYIERRYCTVVQLLYYSTVLEYINSDAN